LSIRKIGLHIAKNEEAEPFRGSYCFAIERVVGSILRQPPTENEINQ